MDNLKFRNGPGPLDGVVVSAPRNRAVSLGWLRAGLLAAGLALGTVLSVSGSWADDEPKTKKETKGTSGTDDSKSDEKGAKDSDKSKDKSKDGEGDAKPKGKEGKEGKAGKSAPIVIEPHRIKLYARSPEELTITTESVKIINQHLTDSWKAQKVQPAKFADDYEFIRRASLDIIGRIATPEEIKKYMSHDAPTRRSMLIEDLLAHEDFPKHWATLFTNWLLTRAGTFGRGKYHQDTQTWLEDKFASNTPYQQLVKELIVSKGDNDKNPAVNFYLAHLGEGVPAAKREQEGQFEMVPITSRITRLFLGVQTQCAQCHDHPFNPSVKQKDFWGINAFLRQVERKGTPPADDNRRMQSMPVLSISDNGKINSDAMVLYEKRNGVILPTKATFLDGTKLDPESSRGRREQLAEFVTNHDNFPKATVNRIWSVFFGRGFTNPVDDFNEQNQPSNPELLDEMSKRFKHYGYDLKRLIRWIANSHAYHLSYAGNRTNDKVETEALFSRMPLKSLSPEQMFESLMVATGSAQSETKDNRRALREAWLNKLVSNFGDDEGNEVNFNGTVVQALLMMNGREINDAITRKDKGTVAKAMKSSSNSQQVINDLFLATYNRPAKAAEIKKIAQALPMRTREKDPMAPYQDVFWALLNSNEFLLNH